jgi:anti-anti-sigma factor
VASGAADVWLDLTRVGFMDSTGLSTLVVGHRELTPPRRLVVICADGPVRNVLAVSGVDRALTIHGSRHAAHADR